MDTLAANFIAPVHGRGLLAAFHSPLYSCDGVVTEKWVGGGGELRIKGVEAEPC